MDGVVQLADRISPSRQAGAGTTRAGEQARAQRFAVSIPLRYRERGQQEWSEGYTENISSSGVLFRGTKETGPRTPIEMSLRLQVNHEGAAEVICQGTLVRVSPGDGTEAQPAMAATITHYRFVRL
jgi:hypothetical protein